MAFHDRVSRPVILDIASPASSLTDFTASDDITFTAEFIPEDTALYEWQYRNLARQYHDRYSFAILPPAKQQSAIRCRNNINDENFTLRELSLVGALEELVSQCAAPLILEPTRKEIVELGQIAQRTGRHVVVHYFTSSHHQKEAYRKEMLALAKKYSGELLFTLVDIKDYAWMASAAGLDAKTGVSVENLQTGELFPYPEGEVTAVKLEAFLIGIGNGTVPSWDGSPPNVAHDEL